MSVPSVSPERNTFQKQNYILSVLERGKSLDDSDVVKMLRWYDSWSEIDEIRLSDVEWQQNNLEWDLRTTDWILEKTRQSKAYAQNLYAALCNNEFIRIDVIEILSDNRWGCSWRGAGGVVANMRCEGDYIDWYCSGMGGVIGGGFAVVSNGGGMGSYDPDEGRLPNYVPEGTVTDEIKQDLQTLGWAVINHK
jgi:hypothetical protein